MPARLVLKDKRVAANGTVVERVVYVLPTASPDRPHGLKYRLYCGRKGRCLVRYDNEAGKGEHVHYGDMEKPYRFVSLERLLRDFDDDVRRLTGG